MANIKDLKVRIKSTKNTFKITSAMKLVSAAKLAKAQAKIVGFKPYSSELDKTVRIATALTADYSHEFLEAKESKVTALLVVSSEKGLCGGYNSQLFKTVKNHIKNNPEREYRCYFIGKKVRELLAREKSFHIESTFTFSKADPSFEEVQNLSKDLSAMFIKGEIGNLEIAYNSFVSAIEFTPTVSQLLPMTVSQSEKNELVNEYPVDFIYEPSSKEILDRLIPEVFVSTVYTNILDALAAEHASRMAAMDNATKNSQEMIRSLTLTMNKLRQAAITTELTEIVSGAESLNS